MNINKYSDLTCVLICKLKSLHIYWEAYYLLYFDANDLLKIWPTIFSSKCIILSRVNIVGHDSLYSYVFRRRLQAVSRLLQDILIKTNIFVLAIHLHNVFKTFSRHLPDVFKTSSKSVFKTSSRPLAKMSSRRFQDISSS